MTVKEIYEETKTATRLLARYREEPSTMDLRLASQSLTRLMDLCASTPGAEPYKRVAFRIIRDAGYVDPRERNLISAKIRYHRKAERDHDSKVTLSSTYRGIGPISTETGAQYLLDTAGNALSRVDLTEIDPESRKEIKKGFRALADRAKELAR